MRSVEISAPTLEGARKAAAFQLGAPEDGIEIEILQKPHKLLGIIGSAEYRIRAIYQEEEKEAPTEGELASETVGEPSPAQETQPEPALEEVEQVALQPPAPLQQEPEHPRQAVAERAQQITADIVGLMGMEVDVNITEITDEEVRLDIEGDESIGLLIGQHGETLDALQLITAIGANAGIDDGCRVILDTEDYRARHEEHLRRRAQEAATEVKQTGCEVVIPDLKGYERRIMHIELRDDPDVETYSEGDERDRRLVISPLQAQ